MAGDPRYSRPVGIPSRMLHALQRRVLQACGFKSGRIGQVQLPVVAVQKTGVVLGEVIDSEPIGFPSLNIGLSSLSSPVPAIH